LLQFAVYVELIISFVPGMGSLSAMENKGGAQRYFRYFMVFVDMIHNGV